MQRWNLPDGWAISRAPAHPALEDGGQERAAYDEWKKLFGDRMTRP